MVKRKKNSSIQGASTTKKTAVPLLLHKKSTNNTTIKEVETLHPQAVYAARNFLSPAECQAWIDLCVPDLEYISHPATRFIAHRECSRWQRTDWDLADQLFQRIQSSPILNDLDFGLSSNKPIGANGNLRLYRYEKGMRFGRHIDESNETERGVTKVTVLIYLSNCQGGATRFHLSRKESVSFAPEVGAILMHVHGQQCLEHEADAVTKGTKYVLRTDLVYGSKGNYR